MRLMQPAAQSLAITLGEQEETDTAAIWDELPWSDQRDGFAVIAARSPQGQVVVYPVTLAQGKTFIAPAPISDVVAQELQFQALEEIKAQEITGVVTTTFDRSDFSLIDLFAGPTRAGLWTLDGARTSQYDQHLRALLDLPFGDPSMSAPLAMTQMVLGGEKPDLFRPFLHLFARDPGLRVHLYGNEVSPGAEIGHVTVLGSDMSELSERAEHAAGYLNGSIDH